MKPSLQLRLSNQLTLTPQLQQAIRLLQLSTLELNQELETILAENPMLERLDDALSLADRIAPDGVIDRTVPTTGSDAERSPPRSGEADGSAGEGMNAGDASWDEDWSSAGSSASAGASDGPVARDDSAPEGPADLSMAGLDWGGDGRGHRADSDDAEQELPQAGTTGRSLQEHLLEQLGGTRASARDQALVRLLIEELDPDGYLRTEWSEIHAALPVELDIDPDELETALALLQSFDPPGVGARSISECLALQLAAIPAALRPERSIMRAALLIVRDHLEWLASRDFSRLKRALRCDDEVLRQAQDLIRSLNPRPGNRFDSTPAAYVTPDILVRRTRQGWRAELNPEVMPRLRINTLYADLLRRNRGSGAGGLSGQLQEARWLMKNVQQRFETIQRVAQAIVERQHAFFTHGAVAMRPLVLREIAEELALHESTISRVTTQKYMHTPFGTYELKYFFGSHVATDSGGTASSTAIRAIIRQLVSEEDGRHPLSDNRMAEILAEQGIVVARRTVAKYREALQIAPASQRKTL
ncbi:MAG: RNA polymerase factor sigma-54 [Burkholderiaceae bacterium]